MEYGFFTFMMMKFYDECFLGVAAAIDARHRAFQHRHYMAAELLVAAALDARHHSYPRRHDMAAGAIRTLIQYPKNN